MRRSGFTLIEVLVALTLAALVVMLAHRIFVAVTDGSQHLCEARARLDRQANARRWLVEAVGSLAVGPTGGSFDGEPAQVTFGAWLPTSSGGFAPSRIVLVADSGRLVARVGQTETLVLESGVRSASFDYLLEPGANERWVGEWISPVSAPLAVRVRISRDGPADSWARSDTLLLLVGPRG